MTDVVAKGAHAVDHHPGSSIADLSDTYLATAVGQTHDAAALGLYFPEAHGATGGGTVDDAAAVNSALIAAAAAKGTCHMQGTYLVKSPLLVGDNTTLRFMPGSSVIRNITGGGATNATIRNISQPGGNSHIRIYGGKVSNLGVGDTGKHLAFQLCNDILVDGLWFAGVKVDWNTYFLDCTDLRISNVYMDSGTAVFEDGLHLDGCQNATIDNCIIKCGDDAIAIVNAFGTQNTSNIVVTNCYVQSRAANGVKIEVYTGSTKTMTAIQVRNVTGSAAAAGLVVHDLNNTNLVTNVSVDGAIFDQSSNTGPGALIGVDGSGNNASCSNIRLSNVSITASQSRCMDVGNPDSLTLTDCLLGSPRAASSQNLLLRNATNVEIRGLHAISSTQVAVQIGTTTACSNVRISGGLIKGATNNGVFVANLAGSTDIYIDGVTFDSNGSGVQDGALTSRVCVTNCNFTNQSNKVNLTGIGSYYRNNPGLNPVGAATPGIPSSGSAVAAVAYDRDFYVTAGASTCSMAIQSGVTVIIPSGGFGLVRVPASKTVTPTYSSAPTWLAQGN